MTVLAFPDISDPVARLVARLRDAKQRGDAWVARCPAHEDRTPSLTVARGKDGRALVRCHAGCASEAIVGALGLTMADLFPPREDAATTPITPPAATPHTVVARYDYTDADGTVLYQVCRMHPKTFRQRRPDGQGGWTWGLGDVEPVLYRLPEVIEAVAMGRRVWIVEGEKDADAIVREAGGVATTCPMGAGKWRESMARALANATNVVILPDNDDPGRAHAEQVAASLTNAGATVRVVPLPGVPAKGDVSDWLDARGDWDDLDELVERTPIWCPDPGKRRVWRLDELLADEVIMRPPLPLIPRLVWRGRSTLLAAQEKSGKSTLVGYLAARVTTGGAFLGDACEAGRVLIYCLEEDKADMARRLKHFNAEPTRLHLAELAMEPAARRDAIEADLERYRPDLLILDTLMAYGRGLVEDENAVAQMQPLVQGLTDLAHRRAVGMIVVHHNKKSGGYRGSSAIGGAVDIIAEMSVPDEDGDPTRRKFRCVGRLPVHGFETRYDGRDYLDAAGIGLPLIQRVLDCVRHNPQTSSNRVRTAIGGRAESVDQALVDLERRRYITDEGDPQSGHRWMASVAAPASVLDGMGGSHGMR